MLKLLSLHISAAAELQREHYVKTSHMLCMQASNYRNATAYMVPQGSATWRKKKDFEGTKQFDVKFEVY